MVIVMEVIIVEVEEMSDDVLFLKPDDDVLFLKPDDGDQQ
jgi:hypothetical protein